MRTRVSRDPWAEPPLGPRTTRQSDAGKTAPLIVFSALAVFVGIALACLAVATLSYLTRPDGNAEWQWVPRRDTELVDIIKVGLTIVGGAGAAVALVVAFRKQLRNERDIDGMRSVRATAIAQLGDPSPTVRLAGVYALVNVAESWPAERQTVANILCAHLRLPVAPADDEHPLATKTIQETIKPAETGIPEKVTTYSFPNDRGEQEVRKTIISVLREHTVHEEWSSLDLDLTGADLTSANLSGANLTDANLTDAKLAHANLADANLTKARLFEANLTRANLMDGNLTHARLLGANLAQAILTNANLIGADLDLTDQRGAVLIAADLTGADLLGGNLTSANLTDANLTDANLTSANLTRANLTRADLTNAELADTNRYRTNLTDANLTDAILTGTILDKTS